MKSFFIRIAFVIVCLGITTKDSFAQEIGYPGAVWKPSPNHYSTVRHKASHDVTTIVLHSTEGSFAHSLSWLRNPDAGTSSSYIIRSSDGYIVQMVDGTHGAWHCGNGAINRHSVGIEQEGYADDPSYFTPALYKSTANVSRWACNYWGIEKTRVNIIGHSEVPDPKDPSKWGGIHHHYDPGGFYAWDSLMQLISYKAPHYQQVKILANSLNVRTRPSGPLITTVSKGQEYVSYYRDPVSGWYLIFLPGENSKHPNGWISGSSSYVKEVPCHNQIRVKGAAMLNVRNKDHSSVLDKVASNQRFVSIKEKNGWYEFYTPASTGDTSGWSSGTYVSLPCDCTLPDPVAVSGAGTYCDSAVITATGGQNGTIYWQGTTRNGAKRTRSSTSQTVTESGTYYFRAYNYCGWGKEDSVKVVINYSPKAVIDIDVTNRNCGSVNIEARAATNGTIYFQGKQRHGTSTADAASEQTVTTSGTYYYRIRNSCGWGTEDSIQVTVANAIPNPVTVAGGGTFCDSTILKATGGGSGTIYWQGTNRNGTSKASPATHQTITASGTYYFRAYNLCGWGPQDSAVVLIQQPNLSIVQDGSNLISNQNNASYQWIRLPDHQSISGETSQSFHPKKNGKYAVIITHKGCIDTSNAFSVTNIAIPPDRFIVYPNPASHYITIKNLNPSDKKYHIILTNELGQTIVNGLLKPQNGIIKNKINIDRIAGSVFFLKITSKSKSSTFKIIKR